jgi:signal transduction histidine kinase/CheY-like chemotaxis protein
MSLKDIKASYIDHMVQIIAVDSLGLILASDDVLFPFKKNQKLEEQHPFFYTLLPLFVNDTVSESFTCVNLEIGTVSKIVDVSILNKEDKFYVILTDFTSRYIETRPIIQKKNNSISEGNKLSFEREVHFAQEKFKNNFLAHLNHDIRNPLNALLGFTDLLSETELTFQQKEILGVLQRTGSLIKVLMDDLLDVSKIEKGVLDIKKVPFNLNTLIAGGIKHFQIKKNNSNVELTYCTESDVPIKLIGDPTRTLRIFYNLIENAFRNTEKGSVVVHTSLIEMIEKDVACLQFKISDTGRGIPDDQLTAVFDSYVQLERERLKPLGTGLGLKIVKDLTAKLGGTVTVDSEVGKGSVFTVILPFKTRNNTPKNKTNPKGSGIIMSKHILAVEDDALSQMLLMKQFAGNERGFKLQIAPNTTAAIQMLKTKKYKVIIIKQTYNATTGIEFIEKLKSHPKLSAIPVLVVSGKAMIKEQEAIINAGAAAFLKKPYSKYELITALQKL